MTAPSPSSPARGAASAAPSARRWPCRLRHRLHRHRRRRGGGRGGGSLRGARARQRSVRRATTSPTSDSHAGLVDAVIARFGRLDCFVSNAGIGSVVRGDMLDLDAEHFDRVLGVNLRGAVFLSQAAAKRDARPPTGRERTIVFVTSVSAEMASPERADYCVSKAALSMWVKTLAARLAPEGIAVFEVRPGHHPHRHDGRRRVSATTARSPTAWCRPALGRERGCRTRRGRARRRRLRLCTGSVIACDGGLSIARL